MDRKQTRLVVVLLLSSVALLVLHREDLRRDQLQLVRQIVHIRYTLAPRTDPTRRHVLRSRSLVDRLYVVPDLISEGNADLVRLRAGEAHGQAERLVEHETEVVLALVICGIHLFAARVLDLQTHGGRQSAQSQPVPSLLPSSPHTMRTTDLQSCPPPKCTPPFRI